MRLINIFALATLLLVSFTVAVSALTPDEAVRLKMAELYDLDTNYYRIDILTNTLRSADVRPDQVTLRPLSTKEPLGLFSVKAIVREDGQILESAQVRMKIRKFADVLVILENVHRSQSITAEQLELKRMEITNLRERPVTDLSKLDGLRAGRNLKRGRILTAGDLEVIPDIENGRDVSIVYTDGLCRISAEGRSLQSGIAGEYIKVRNKASGKVIMARVIDGTAVAVDP